MPELKPPDRGSQGEEKEDWTTEFTLKMLNWTASPVLARMVSGTY